MSTDKMIGKYKRMLRDEERRADYYKKRYYEVSKKRDNYKEMCHTYEFVIATLVLLLLIAALIFITI